MCERTNEEMDRRMREGEVSQTYEERYRAETVKVEELLMIFGVRMKLGLRNDKIGLTKRMRLVLISLRWDWIVFVNLLRSNWKRCIHPGEICYIDEALFTFKPRGKQNET